MSSKRKLNYNDNKNNNKYYYTYSYYSNNNKQQQQRLRLAPQSNNNNNSIKLSACSPMEIYERQQITTTRTATSGGWSKQFASGRGGVYTMLAASKHYKAKCFDLNDSRIAKKAFTLALSSFSLPLWSLRNESVPNITVSYLQFYLQYSFCDVIRGSCCDEHRGRQPDAKVLVV